MYFGYAYQVFTGCDLFFPSFILHRCVAMFPFLICIYCGYHMVSDELHV